MTPEKRWCLQALVLTDPEDDKNALKRRKGERAPKTYSWIIDTTELQKWIGVRNSTAEHSPKSIKGDFRLNLPWLYGNPGTGKSTVAITMAEELPKQPYFDTSKSLAYLFCDSSAADRRTAVSILRGLVPANQEQT
jgi:DNA polymerase III delta prime subunit